MNSNNYNGSGGNSYNSNNNNNSNINSDNMNNLNAYKALFAANNMMNNNNNSGTSSSSGVPSKWMVPDYQQQQQLAGISGSSSNGLGLGLGLGGMGGMTGMSGMNNLNNPSVGSNVSSLSGISSSNGSGGSDGNGQPPSLLPPLQQQPLLLQSLSQQPSSSTTTTNAAADMSIAETIARLIREVDGNKSTNVTNDISSGAGSILPAPLSLGSTAMGSSSGNILNNKVPLPLPLLSGSSTNANDNKSALNNLFHSSNSGSSNPMTNSNMMVNMMNPMMNSNNNNNNNFNMNNDFMMNMMMNQGNQGNNSTNNNNMNNNNSNNNISAGSNNLFDFSNLMNNMNANGMNMNMNSMGMMNGMNALNNNMGNINGMNSANNMMMNQMMMSTLAMNPMVSTMMMTWQQQIWQLICQLMMQSQAQGGNPMMAIQVALTQSLTSFASTVNNMLNGTSTPLSNTGNSNNNVGNNMNTGLNSNGTTGLGNLNNSLNSNSYNQVYGSNNSSNITGNMTTNSYNQNTSTSQLNSSNNTSNYYGQGTLSSTSPSFVVKKEQQQTKRVSYPPDVSGNVLMLKKTKREHSSLGGGVSGLTPTNDLQNVSTAASPALEFTSLSGTSGVAVEGLNAIVANKSTYAQDIPRTTGADGSHPSTAVSNERSSSTVASTPCSIESAGGVPGSSSTDAAVAKSLLSLSNGGLTPNTNTFVLPVTSNDGTASGGNNAAISSSAEAMLAMMLGTGSSSGNAANAGATSSNQMMDYGMGGGVGGGGEEDEDEEDECYFVPGMKRRRNVNQNIQKISFYAWDGLLIEHVKNFENLEEVVVPSLQEWLHIFANNDITTAYEYSVFTRMASPEHIDDIITMLKQHAVTNQKKNDSIYKREFGWMYLKDQLKFGRTQMLSTIYWTIFVVYMYHHADYAKYKITQEEFRIKYMIPLVQTSSGTTGTSGSNPLFHNLDELEIQRLVQFRNVLAIAFQILPAHRNEVLLLRIAACLERSGKKYQISSSGQMMATTRRRFIYRREANMKLSLSALQAQTQQQHHQQQHQHPSSSAASPAFPVPMSLPGLSGLGSNVLSGVGSITMQGPLTGPVSNMFTNNNNNQGYSMGLGQLQSNYSNRNFNQA